MTPGSTWVELTHGGFCSVNAYLPGLNPGKLNPVMEVGSLFCNVNRDLVWFLDGNHELADFPGIAGVNIEIFENCHC